MRNSAIGRFIVRSRRIWRDLVFRGLAILSLTLFAIWHPWNYPGKIQYPYAQQSAEDRRESADERIADYTFWLDVGTFLLAVSTLGLWIITWQSGIKQSRDTAKSLRVTAEASVAAKKSADAAMLAVGSERAWMCYEGINHDTHTNLTLHGVYVGDAIAVQVIWKNKGRSPALKCDIYFEARPISFDETRCPQFVPVWRSYTSGTTCATELPVTTGQYFVHGNVRDIFNRYEMAFAVYSAVRYFDVFGKEQRLSEVCIKFFYIGQRREPDGRFAPFYGHPAFGDQNTLD
jgi:hypothetical protein